MYNYFGLPMGGLNTKEVSTRPTVCVCRGGGGGGWGGAGGGGGDR